MTVVLLSEGLRPALADTFGTDYLLMLGVSRDTGWDGKSSWKWSSPHVSYSDVFGLIMVIRMKGATMPCVLHFQPPKRPLGKGCSMTLNGLQRFLVKDATRRQ